MNQTLPVSLRRTRRAALRTLLPAGAGLGLALAGDLTLYAVLPAYAGSLGIPLASIGLLLSANRFIRFLSNPLVGLLANRVSRKRLVTGGFLLGLIATLLYVAGSVALMLVGRVLWGISWSIMYIGLYCMIIDVTGQGERGWGMGLLQAFYFTGMAITPVLGGLLTNRYGFTGGLLACAAIQAAGLLLALLFQAETFVPARAGALESESLQTQVRRLRRSLAGFSLSRVLAHRDLLLANYIYMATVFVGDGIIMSTIALYLQQRYGAALSFGSAALPVTAVGGALISLRAGVSALAAPLAGYGSDRAGGSRWGYAAAGAAITIAGCALLSLDGSFALVLAGVFLASSGSGMLLAVLTAIVSSAPGQQGSFAMGLLTTSGDLGSATAPLAGYALLRVLSLSRLYLISGGLLLVGLLLCLVMLRRAPVPAKRL